jgi:restriction system protein
MAVPDYETLMLPVLKFLGDGNDHKTSEIVSHVSNEFDLSQDDREALIPSGRAKLVNNRVGWACTYLRKAGLISSPQRGVNRITEDGRSALQRDLSKIDRSVLMEYPRFAEFQEQRRANPDDGPEVSIDQRTPDEIIAEQTEIINASLRRDLLDMIADMDPDRFEQLVVDLLIAMGYGGAVDGAGLTLGKSNDGGVDGLIKEDVLGLDNIYVQAKRWQAHVPIKEVRDFAGALLSKRSNKGVFITTSGFPKSAHEFVDSIDRKIVLIDGEMLARLMVKYGLGVTTNEVIELKELDSDFFAT